MENVLENKKKTLSLNSAHVFLTLEKFLKNAAEVLSK